MEAVLIASYALTFVTKIKNASEKAKKKIEEKMKNYTIEDVSVLSTMLLRCSQSTNNCLKADLEHHSILERIRTLIRFLTDTHFHSEACHPGGEGEYNFFSCIETREEWLNVSKKIRRHTRPTVPNTVNINFLDVIANVAKDVIDSKSHQKQVEKDIDWVVKELEGLYRQTSAIMLANNLQ